MIIRRNLLALSIVTALSFYGVAHAETAAEAAVESANNTESAADPRDTQELEEVVVKGIRQSMQKSLDTKRDAESHVDVITAEDIGKMPDKNVADSLQRVVGVTISSASANEGGFDENDRVSMRGTNASLTQTLINGHPVSSGDWFVLNQTGSVGRSVSYSLLPSQLVGSVVVHKTAQASDVEGGVAGYVNIQTRSPLDFAEPLTIEGSVGGVHAELPDKNSPQFSGLLNWKNAGGTMGLMVQAFSEERHLRRDGQELLGYEQIAPDSAVAAANPSLANVWYPTLIGSALFEQERKRQGGLVDLEIRAGDRLDLNFSAFKSKMDASNYNRNYMFWLTHVLNRGAGQGPDSGYVVRNNTLVSANFSPVAGTTYGVYDQISRPDSSSDSMFFNFDATFRATDALIFTSKVGTTRGHGKTPTQDVAEWNTGIGTGGWYSINGIDRAASWGLGNENTGSPSANTLGWIFGAQNINVRDDEQWLQLDGEYSFNDGAFTLMRFGVRSSDHDRKSDGVIGQGPRCSDGSAFNWDPVTFNCVDPATSPFNPANYPNGFQNYPGDFGSDLGGVFPRNIWYYSPEQLAAYNARFTNRDPVTRSDWSQNYALSERNDAAYIQGDLAGDGWSANIGLRYVRTQEHVIANVNATAQTPGAITTSAFGPYLPTAFDNTYKDWLPSANLKLEVADDLIARFAASKTMTRPDYSALAGPISLSPPAVAGGVGSGSGSNPNLKPVRSTNFDASLEWYFAPNALLSAGVFYMDLKSYISLGRITETYLTFDQNNPQGVNVPYVLTVPVNSSGKVKGVELAYEQPLSDHFGISANYTYTDGKEVGNRPLVGTSKNTYTVGGYFENERFNARVSYTYRSSFYSGLDRATAFSQAEAGYLSASLGYTFSDNFALSLDGMNLNQPKLKYYALNEDQPRSIYSNGRQYYLTARFKF
ncbi:TonB-dependent receptor [Tahibacter sp.]|uniref:TonB-dependent receptor n=1 Tax=Tahibacter sp. TaxID=2056211 RepID=UPI0028C3E21A|nr:TonB-dependent receptor [Tahibacter sp.]